MRLHIEHLSSTAMNWERLSPGVYRKMLNHNQGTDERTALFHFVPSEGANPPNVCHYHSVYEELFILDGRMTFDHKTWLGENGYVFHPPFAVHGFDSAISEPTTFIARAPAELDFNYPETTNRTKPFFIEGKTANREITYLNPPGENSWSPLTSPEGKEIGQRFILNVDRDTGEGSSLIRFNQGFNAPFRPQGYDTFNEGFVLSGRVIADDGAQWTAGDYWHRRPGKSIPALIVSESALIFSSVGPG